MIEWIYILCVIIIIKSEVWTITHCLGLGHETMVSAVGLSMFLWESPPFIKAIKTLLIVFKGLHGKAPTYIQEMITPSKSKRYSIRSNEERVLKVPKCKHDTFGKRAFAVYGPLAWNCLSKEIRLCDEIEAFKPKTHLFVKFVNESTLAIWFWRIIVKRPRMLSAQFVALYKPCKPKPCKPKPIMMIPLMMHRAWW